MHSEGDRQIVRQAGRQTGRVRKEKKIRTRYRQAGKQGSREAGRHGMEDNHQQACITVVSFSYQLTLSYCMFAIEEYSGTYCQMKSCDDRLRRTTVN